MRGFLKWAAGLALALAAGGAQAGPDLANMTHGELTAFTKAMPKGGELHNHVAGAIFPETFLAWAVEDGLCVDVEALALRPPCEPAGNLKSAAAVFADDALRSALYDSLTTRHPGFRDRSGHDQFFSAFARFGAAGQRRGGDMLAQVMEDLARQNTFYLEAMVTPQGASSTLLGAKVGWKGDFAAQAAGNLEAGLGDLVAAAVTETDALEARAREVLKCGTAEPMAGCQVTVRYLVQTNRVAPLAATFAQLQLGVALIQRDRRWVGLQMVAPEDHPSALANYSEHMRMVAFLTDGGRLAPAALHAGELSFKYATPGDLRFHVAEAVRVAGARRIGHGVDLPHEDGAEALVAEMAEKGVLVEVNLTSNHVILETSGEAHPYAWLRQRGVPVSLSTDDAGILRIDLSHEYARAARETGAGYDDLKRSARNAIAFSFLAGEGLWRDPNAYRKPHPACAGQIGRAEPRPGRCAELISASDKAREQWRHEHLLARFEAGR
ncbi:MAG: adenosine deaminase [Phenylobacterium sp.]|uniref:adenosine deaminase family protein n=1 Tax=Phenylobacterium sp. TaxID=1871053 RepID=UPI00391DA177